MTETLLHDARRLTEHLQERLGDALRRSLVYTPDEEEFLYVRSDLVTELESDELPELLDEARSIHRSINRAEQSGLAFGSPLGSVHTFENAYIIQFPYDDERGVIVALDQDVGRHLFSFLNECLNELGPY